MCILLFYACLIWSADTVQGHLEAPVLSRLSTSAVLLPRHLCFLHIEVRGMYMGRRRATAGHAPQDNSQQLSVGKSTASPTETKGSPGRVSSPLHLRISQGLQV